MTNEVRGLGEHVALKDVPREEVRFGVVLNGGVSLAVWMGGTVTELDRLAKADPDRPDSPYALMLRLAGCVARVDVIAGTSAGGINGAALALAQVNQAARIASRQGHVLVANTCSPGDGAAVVLLSRPTMEPLETRMIRVTRAQKEPPSVWASLLAGARKA